jgi:hypothetical protein
MSASVIAITLAAIFGGSAVGVAVVFCAESREAKRRAADPVYRERQELSELNRAYRKVCRKTKV